MDPNQNPDTNLNLNQNLISNLPDEKLLEICEKMDLATLNQYIRSSKKAHQVCSEILDKRRIRFQSLKNKLIEDQQINFTKSYPFYDSYISVTLLTNDNTERNLVLSQRLFPKSHSLEEWPFDWIINREGWWDSEREITRPFYKRYGRSTIDQLPKIFEKIDQAGYKDIL